MVVSRKQGKRPHYVQVKRAWSFQKFEHERQIKVKTLNALEIAYGSSFYGLQVKHQDKKRNGILMKMYLCSTAQSETTLLFVSFEIFRSENEWKVFNQNHIALTWNWICDKKVKYIKIELRISIGDSIRNS